MIDLKFILAGSKAFPLGNVIVCTRPSVAVSLFNLRKILNETTASDPPRYFYYQIARRVLNLLQLCGRCIYTSRCSN